MVAGHIIKGTPIAVDYWKPDVLSKPYLYFLTHLHADHTDGLTKSWRFPIYTSPINARLLKHKFQMEDRMINKLTVGETYELTARDIPITVTVLDANHIPGSIMFLFQGYFGNILYCGDMRWYPSLVEHPVLAEVVHNKTLDYLYLDNTYSHPACVFPPRHEAKQEIINIIESHPEHIIKLSVRNYGREDLLEALGKHFEEYVAVSLLAYQKLQLLGYSNVFTTNYEEARIHAIPMYMMRLSTHKKWNNSHPTISIMLTALYMSENWHTGSRSEGYYVVPYSDHSSYPELMEMQLGRRMRSVVEYSRAEVEKAFCTGQRLPYTPALQSPDIL